jgi:hypothetical protein
MQGVAGAGEPKIFTELVSELLGGFDGIQVR